MDIEEMTYRVLGGSSPCVGCDKFKECIEDCDEQDDYMMMKKIVEGCFYEMQECESVNI